MTKKNKNWGQLLDSTGLGLICYYQEGEEDGELAVFVIFSVFLCTIYKNAVSFFFANAAPGIKLL